MSDAPIYLDYNATTPVHPAVREAMSPWLHDKWGNPSSAHAFGREAAAAVAKARADVAALVGASPEEIVFTAGGTEADNLALLGAPASRPRVVVSAVEHPAIEGPAGILRAGGFVHAVLPVDRRGVVDLDRARSVLAEPCGILSVILAQNETGVIQPVAELAAIARAVAGDVIVHSDAAQAVGKIPVDVRTLDVDLLTIVGHKLYAPAGIGALYVKDGLVLRPRLHGGGQERGLRPGTEPVALVVALGAACALARADLEIEGARQAELRDRLWARLAAAVPGIARTGEGAPVLPGTLHVRFFGRTGAEVLARAPSVAASTGSACHSGDEASGAAQNQVLAAMGVDAASARGAVRLSLGRRTTEAEIDAAAAALVAAAS
jgi:cysteine desulfurase